MNSLASAMDLISAINLFCGFALTGLIWTVQIVHYPSFRFVAPVDLAEFARFHANRITWIVAPLMLGELLTALALLLRDPNLFWIANFMAIAATWIFTILLSVPLHKRLQTSPDLRTIERLIVTNWPRTACWSARSAACLAWAVGTFN